MKEYEPPGKEWDWVVYIRGGKEAPYKEALRALRSEVLLAIAGLKAGRGGHSELGLTVYLHIARCTRYYVIFSHRVPLNTVSAGSANQGFKILF